MSSARGVDADVVIVGCGPVGLTLAVLLGQRGRSVIALERWPEPYPLPRAVHFDHEVARIFQACGIGDELRSSIEPAEVYEWRNAQGVLLLRFGQIGDGSSGWPASAMFHQPGLEALLEARCEELTNVEIRRGVEVSTMEMSADHVVVRARDGAEVRAEYAVGCDGANSTVRTLADLSMHDLGFFYDWLIVDVILHEPRVFDPINLQICDPLRPTTAVSGGPGRRRWEFMRLPHEPVDDLQDESRAWELLADWDVRPDNATLERQAVYTFNARYADQWRSGRVLLAGDAAHLIPPFAGQGMCSGIRDAANLAWKLDTVIEGRAPDELLDTYQAERLPHVRRAIDFSMELGKVICVPDPDEAAARDEAMAAMVGDGVADTGPLPPLDAGLIDTDSPHAGHVFVQGRVDGHLADDIHGVGWRLVTDLGDPSDDDTGRWFASIGGRVIELDQPDATYQRWFDDHGTHYALQRPDFSLFGTATDADGAQRLLTRLRGALQHPASW